MRLAVIIGLVLSLLLLGKAALQSWQKIEIPTSTREVLPLKAPAAPERQGIAVNPQVPVLMPDLNAGYLFNVQRSFSEQEGEEASPGESADEPSSQVNMDTLVYTGSIIIGHLRKGLVSFALQEEGPSPAPIQRRGRYMARRPVPKTTEQQEMVNEGEDFYGFKVASVQPDRILFTKSGSSIEKMLYDPNKERKAAGSPNIPPTAGRGNAAQRAPEVPRPGPTGPAGQTGVVNSPTARPAAGAVPVTPPHSVPTPAVRTPAVRNMARRPQVIQRRRLPVQTR